MEPISPTPSIDPAARLCLACGLCCQGVLYGSVRLQPDDVPIAEGLGLPVIQESGQPALAQPMPCFKEGRCSIYETRFSRCRSYRRMLLQRVEEGSETVENALGIVRQTKTVVDTLRGLLGEHRAARQIWYAVGDYIRTARAAGTVDDVKSHAAVYLNMRIRSLLSHRYFDHRVQEQWNAHDLPLKASSGGTGGA